MSKELFKKIVLDVLKSEIKLDFEKVIKEFVEKKLGKRLRNDIPRRGRLHKEIKQLKGDVLL